MGLLLHSIFRLATIRMINNCALWTTLFCVLFASQSLGAPHTRADRDLYNAISEGDWRQAQAAIGAGADVNMEYSRGKTPLMMAVLKDNFQIVQMLLQNKAVSLKKNSSGMNALRLALYKRNKAMVRAMVESHTGDVNYALFEAIQCGKASMVQFLIHLKADVNVAGERGRTPLMETARSGAVRIMHVLLKHGALPNKQDNDGITALMEAVKTSFYSDERMMEMVDLLLSHSADVNKQSEDGHTALMYIVKNRVEHSELVERLIQAEANVHRTNSDGYTALMLAAQNGHRDCVEQLLNAGADVTARTPAGDTALNMAREQDIFHVLHNALLAAHAFAEFHSHPHAAAARRLRSETESGQVSNPSI